MIDLQGLEANAWRYLSESGATSLHNWVMYTMVHIPAQFSNETGTVADFGCELM